MAYVLEASVQRIKVFHGKISVFFFWHNPLTGVGCMQCPSWWLFSFDCEPRHAWHGLPGVACPILRVCLSVGWMHASSSSFSLLSWA